MKRALLVVLLLLAKAAMAAPLFAREAVDLKREAELAAGEGKRLAVLIEREDCAYCERMKRAVFPSREARRGFGAWFRTVAVRADAGGELIAPDGARTTAAAFAARLRLSGTPAFAFFDAAGALETRHQGALPDAASFNALGRYVRQKGYEALPFAVWRTQRAAAARKAGAPAPDGAVCTTRRHDA